MSVAPGPVPATVGSHLVCARCRRPARAKRPGPTDPRQGQPEDTALPPVDVMGYQGRSRLVSVVRWWPEGPVCSGCFARACESYGRCILCRRHRLLPGMDAHGQPALCTDCAGGLGDFTCPRCGQEGWRHGHGGCARCVLTDRLSALLDRGDGTLAPALGPFLKTFTAMDRPRSGMLWLSKPHVPALLRALATEAVPLTHAGLDTLAPPKAVTHLRDLLVASGVLPPVDRFLAQFQQWLTAWQQEITDPDHARILHRYAAWCVHHRLLKATRTAPVGPYRVQNARTALRQAEQFLVFLADADLTLATCTQADLDCWVAEAPTYQPRVLRPFIRWANTTRITRNLHMGIPPEGSRPPLEARAQIDLLRRALNDPAMSVADKVLVLLVGLYAQPLTRIVALTIHDVARTGTEVTIALGDPASPVPAPLDRIFLEHLAHRENLATATNPDSQLLFPGRRAHQSLHPATLRLRLRNLGVANLDSRRGALRQLLLSTPAPIVAEMLGYTSATTERIARESGRTWADYVHLRTSD